MPDISLIVREKDLIVNGYAFKRPRDGNYLAFYNPQQFTVNKALEDPILFVTIKPYKDIIIPDRSGITCLPWDGSRGGIVFLYADRLINVEGVIDVREKSGKPNGAGSIYLIAPEINIEGQIYACGLHSEHGAGGGGYVYIKTRTLRNTGIIDNSGGRSPRKESCGGDGLMDIILLKD